MLDWDTFYFEYWVEEHGYDVLPDQEDYYGWLFDKYDIMVGYRNEV